MEFEYLNRKLEEIKGHLLSGRYRLALKLSKELYQLEPDNPDVLIVLGWSLLENGDPTKAIELANRSIELKPSSDINKAYRGYLLSRLNIFEGAISDFDKSIVMQRDTLSWTLLNKARALSGKHKFKEALVTIQNAVEINTNKTPFTKTINYIKKAKELKERNEFITKKNVKYYFDEANSSIETKDFWFALYISNIVLEIDKLKQHHKKFYLIKLEALIRLQQIKPALTLITSVKNKFKDEKKFDQLINLLENIKNKNIDIEDKVSKESAYPVVSSDGDESAFFYDNEYIEIFSLKMFDAIEDKINQNRNYYKQFDPRTIKYIGAEIIFDNQFYEKKDIELKGKAVWYLNDYEMGHNNFNLKLNKDWDSIIFVQTWGTDKEDFWEKGKGKVEIYIEEFKVCEKIFLLDDGFINEIEEPEEEEIEEVPKVERELEEIDLNKILDELNGFIGLNSIKEKVNDLVDYLKFQNVRKEKGFKSDENISFNAIFLGNPGTGKTTIARLLGKILKALSIIESGHVVEVDRSQLVGQYIGETAQKTDKIIQDAKGGVLFIDEAYTLIKEKSGGQDFGQEAIDILLKRMEDMKGEFVVIAAGYPEQMKGFLDSNPGLKSRFSHTFDFEDYSPEELIHIFEKYLGNEDYSATEEAKEYLQVELTKMFRERDHSFGNAREVRKVFEESKINLGKRFISLPEEMQTHELMNLIEKDDIEPCFMSKSKKVFSPPINKEELSIQLEELENMVGLENVKSEIKNLIKLAEFYNEMGEDLSDKLASHFIFEGNPGTGKTTVARIIGKIYSALGILPKGHLIETDRKGLVAPYVGQTAQKTSDVIDQAIGGTLFIDEAYTLTLAKSDNDFGTEAIEVLLKRMEDERSEFIVIAAGYTEEMKLFLESNPGVKSRFSKVISFEDYSPSDLMKITSRTMNEKGINISLEAKNLLIQHYTSLYRTREKSFGNARIVRTIIEQASNNMMLRFSGLPKDKRDNFSKEIIPSDLETILKSRKTVKKTNYNELDKHLESLNELVGLNDVKRRVVNLVNSLKISEMKRDKGVIPKFKNINSLFIGNEGSGKKEIAELLGKIFQSLGILSSGNVIVKKSSDILREYEEQINNKKEYGFSGTEGKVLYIDDLSLISTHKQKREILEFMISQYKFQKDDLSLILSGTSKEIEDILNISDEFKELFSNYFNFDDYTPRELLEIIDISASENGYKLDEGALQSFFDLFEDVYNYRSENFKNKIVAEKILMFSISNQEERIAKMVNPKDEELSLIKMEDINKIDLNYLSKKVSL